MQSLEITTKKLDLESSVRSHVGSCGNPPHREDRGGEHLLNLNSRLGEEARGAFKRAFLEPERMHTNDRFLAKCVGLIYFSVLCIPGQSSCWCCCS